ncbi:MAG: hypothetical protein OEY99_05830 [Aigarchaeota archaeon]|nr:hypothetical protein [Aigarchaeota archaeon]
MVKDSPLALTVTRVCTQAPSSASSQGCHMADVACQSSPPVRSIFSTSSGGDWLRTCFPHASIRYRCPGSACACRWMPASAVIKSNVISWECSPVRTLAASLNRTNKEDWAALCHI